MALNNSGTQITYDPVDCKPFYILGDRDDSQCGGNTPCYPNSGTRKGSCITPISILGKASQVFLTGSSHGGGTRLLSTSESGGGIDDVYLQGEYFNLSNPLEMNASDNAEDHNDYSSAHSGVAVKYDYIDVKFALPRKENNQSVTKYWTIRYALVSVPFTGDKVYNCSESNGVITCTDANKTIGECINRYASEQTRSDYNEENRSATVDEKAANYYDGLTSVKKGDILFCIKDGINDTCGASDWKWLNKSTNTLVSSRPSQNSDIFTFSHLANHKSVCEELDDSEGLNIDLGGWELKQSLYNNIKFNAQYKDGGLKVYDYQDVNGNNQEGSELDLYLDFDVQNAIILYDEINQGTGNYVDLNYTNLGSNFATLRDMNDSEIAQKIWFKPVFAYNFSGCDPMKAGDCENIKNGMKANLKITLSGETEPPIYECADDEMINGQCVGEEDPYSGSQYNNGQ
jgi:hypothetical protein